MTFFGATKQEWTTIRGLEIDQDLLPVVSNAPGLEISEKSSLTSIGKVPSTFDHSGKVVGFRQWQDHLSAAEEIEKWQDDPRLGISVITRNVRAIDIDIDDEVQAQAVVAFVTESLGLALPCRSRSNSGKCLLILKAPGNIPKKVISTPYGKIEFLGTGQQFIAAGTHPSGQRYQWSGDGSLSVPLITAERLDELFLKMKKEFSVGTPLPNNRHLAAGIEGSMLELNCDFPWLGGRTLEPVRATQVLSLLKEALPFLHQEAADEYESWIQVGLALKSVQSSCSLEESSVLSQLWHDFSSKSDCYDQSEAEQKWQGFEPKSVDFRYVFRLAHANGWMREVDLTLSEADLTDASNLDVLANLSNGTLRFIAEEHCWLFWDGSQWHRDPQKKHAQRLALMVADFYERALTQMSIAKDLQSDNRTKLIKELNKWYRNCRSRRGVDDLLRLAMSDARFLIHSHVLDANNRLIGVANGVVDLTTGALRENAREDLVTRYSDVPFDATAKRDGWEKFISEITGLQDSDIGIIEARPALVGYLQRMIGYCLTGLTHEHKMFVAVGDGANGKSVLFDTLADIFPNAVRTMPPELLMAHGGVADPERASPLLASLNGVRMAISSESKAGQKFDVALIKRHTGGGRLQARRLRENSVEFDLTHKLVVMTNHRPSVDHLDDAFKGRIHIIPFDVQWNRPGSSNKDIRLPDGDKELMSRLKSEQAGILAWCIEGAQSYMSFGLEPPAEVVDATQQYLREEDHFEQWMTLCRTCVDARQGTLAEPLLKSCNHWLTDNGANLQMSTREFSREMTKRGVRKVSVREGTKYALLPAVSVSEF